MSLVVIPDTEAFALLDATPSPLDRVQRRGVNAHLGRGVIRPFRRGANNDFANADGADLVRSCVGQILGMRGSSDFTTGELPWDPERGSLLQLLRHQNNDLVLRELGRVYVTDALSRWEPRVVVRSVNIFRDTTPDGSSILVIELLYDVIRINVPGNQVALEGVEQTLELKAS